MDLVVVGDNDVSNFKRKTRGAHMSTVSVRGVRGSDWAGKGQYFYPIRH